MNEPTRIRARCACGWESAGPVDRVVMATIEHGQRQHNMVATRDQVLERAEVLADDAEPSTGAAASPGTSGT